MANRNDIVAELLAECENDHVGLWEVVRAVQDDLGIRDPAEVRSATLEIVRTLLDQPGVEAGFPAADGRHFDPWRVSKDKAMKKIEQQWEALGRTPNIGDIVWFSLEAQDHATNGR